jgi:uncharacterized LabA/DUF88 family protein
VPQRGRTILFIDNSTVFQGQLTAGWRIDYKKLHAYLEREGEIWQAFFFDSMGDPSNPQQANVYRFIKNEMRYEVYLFELGSKTVRCPSCGTVRTIAVEKGVDVALATKLLVLANARAFDTAILVAADKDYLETVRVVKGSGLRVEIVAWKHTISKEMENESSRAPIYFDDIREHIEHPPNDANGDGT